MPQKSTSGCQNPTCRHCLMRADPLEKPDPNKKGTYFKCGGNKGPRLTHCHPFSNRNQSSSLQLSIFSIAPLNFHPLLAVFCSPSSLKRKAILSKPLCAKKIPDQKVAGGIHLSLESSPLQSKGMCLQNSSSLQYGGGRAQRADHTDVRRPSDVVSWGHVPFDPRPRQVVDISSSPDI